MRVVYMSVVFLFFVVFNMHSFLGDVFFLFLSFVGEIKVLYTIS